MPLVPRHFDQRPVNHLLAVDYLNNGRNVAMMNTFIQVLSEQVGDPLFGIKCDNAPLDKVTKDEYCHQPRNLEPKVSLVTTEGQKVRAIA